MLCIFIMPLTGCSLPRRRRITIVSINMKYAVDLVMKREQTATLPSTFHIVLRYFNVTLNFEPPPFPSPSRPSHQTGVHVCGKLWSIIGLVTWLPPSVLHNCTETRANFFETQTIIRFWPTGWKRKRRKTWSDMYYYLVSIPSSFVSSQNKDEEWREKKRNIKIKKPRNELTELFH